MTRCSLYVDKFAKNVDSVYEVQVFDHKENEYSV